MLGAAISPLLFVTTILILSSRQKPKLKATSFFLGALLSIGLVGFVIFFLVHIGAQKGISSHSSDLLHIGVGLLLLWLAWRNLTKRKKKSQADKRAKKSALPLAGFFAVGIGLMLSNVTTLAMFVPAAVELSSHGATLSTRLVVLTLMILFAMLPALVPIVLVVFIGRAGDVLLARLSEIMQRQGNMITAIFFALIGFYCITRGAGGYF